MQAILEVIRDIFVEDIVSFFRRRTRGNQAKTFCQPLNVVCQLQTLADQNGNLAQHLQSSDRHP
ncbi:MAG: hypothetical protein J07HQX50_00790 [Haloquadratum sp. J07HQX50]|nr:MAG: hypothetical protein J07HQX50_00790 [Haloquadratum sp. J07HQX50]